jgi:hypothetical protein
MAFPDTWMESVYARFRRTRRMFYGPVRRILSPRFAASFRTMHAAVPDIGGSSVHDVDMVFLRQKILFAKFQELNSNRNATADARLKTELAYVAVDANAPIRNRSFYRSDNHGYITIHIDCVDAKDAKIDHGITLTVIQGRPPAATVIPFDNYVAGKSVEAKMLVGLIGKWSPPSRRNELTQQLLT